LATGPNLSLKSAVAKYLHERLQIGLVQSAYVGPILDADGKTSSEHRARRRERLLRLVDVYLEDGLPILVDAAFHHKDARGAFYEHLLSLDRTINIVVLFCHSYDPEVREFRRLQRETAASPLEVETVSRKGAQESVSEYESPLDASADNLRYPVISVDTDHYSVRATNLCGHRDAGTIEEIETILRAAFAVGEV
jgi:predicted kinase